MPDTATAPHPPAPRTWRQWYYDEEALGELVVYPTPVELVGGQQTAPLWSPDFPWICTPCSTRLRVSVAWKMKNPS